MIIAEELLRHQQLEVWLVGWLVYVPLTARSFRDAPPFIIPCEGREARFLHRSNRESNPVPLRGSSLHYRCAMAAPRGLETPSSKASVGFIFLLPND